MAIHDSTAIQMDRVWRPVFDRYDHDKNGKIRLGDFKKALKEGNEHLSEDIEPEVLEKLIRPKHEDEMIDYDQFLEMIHDSELGVQKPRLHRLVRYAAMAVVPKSQRKSVIRQYLDEYNCMPPPIFVIIISLIEIAIFIYYCIVLGEFSTIGPVPWKSLLIYNPCKRHEIWRFFTYIFIHAGFYHVFFNTIIQLFLGIPLEMVHKWWRIMLVYVTGVIAGSLASSITDPNTYLAGASGGVYALLAAHLANVIINWSEMEFNWVRLLCILTFVSTDVGVAIYGRYIEEKRSQVSYSAHFAGALVGLFIGVNVLRNLKSKRWEVILGWFTLTLYILLTGFAILFNIFNEKYFYDPNDPEVCVRDFY